MEDKTTRQFITNQASQQNITKKLHVIISLVHKNNM